MYYIQGIGSNTHTHRGLKIAKLYSYAVELKQTSESVGYPFETYILSRIVPNFFKQF